MHKNAIARIYDDAVLTHGVWQSTFFILEDWLLRTFDNRTEISGNIYPFLLKKKKQEAHNFHFERLKMLILLADAVWKEKPLHEVTQKKIVQKTQKNKQKMEIKFYFPF